MIATLLCQFSLFAHSKSELRTELIKIVDGLDAFPGDDLIAALNNLGVTSDTVVSHPDSGTIWVSVEPGVRDEGIAPPPGRDEGADLWGVGLFGKVEDERAELRRPVTKRDLIDRDRQLLKDIERLLGAQKPRQPGPPPDNAFRGVEAMYEVALARCTEFCPLDQVSKVKRDLDEIRRDIHAGGDGRQFRLDAAVAKDAALSRAKRAAAAARVTANKDRWAAADAGIKQKRKAMKRTHGR
jgi:hypothetical protein